MCLLSNISSLRDSGKKDCFILYQYAVPLGLSRRDNILVESELRGRISPVGTICKNICCDLS